MQVKLSPDTEAKFQLASNRGRDVETLAHEAIERLVGYDAWFLGEVDKGLVQVDRGDVLTHEAVARRLERHLRNDPPRF